MMIDMGKRINMDLSYDQVLPRAPQIDKNPVINILSSCRISHL